MADDLAPVAIARPSSVAASAARHGHSAPIAHQSFAARADRGVEIFSRWAGIVTFAAAVGATCWYLFP